MENYNNDVIDALFYPAYQKLSKFIPKSVHPNHLSVISFFFVICASLSLIFISSRESVLFSALSLYLWTVFDALDGLHARNTKQTTNFGGFFDHFLDNIGSSVFFISLIYAFDLFYMVFVLAIYMRVVTGIIGFISISYTGKFFIPKLGATCEIFIFIGVLIAGYFFPGNIINFSYKLEILKDLSGVEGVSIIGFGILSYFILAPLTIFKYFLATLKELK